MTDYSISRDEYLEAKLAKDWTGNIVGLVVNDKREGDLNRYTAVCNSYNASGSGGNKNMIAKGCNILVCESGMIGCTKSRGTIKLYHANKAVTTRADELSKEEKDGLRKLRGI